MSNNKPKPIPQELKDSLIKYFLNNQDNSIQKMAKIFGISAYRINNVIDEHLNLKK